MVVVGGWGGVVGGGDGFVVVVRCTTYTTIPPIPTIATLLTTLTYLWPTRCLLSTTYTTHLPTYTTHLPTYLPLNLVRLDEWGIRLPRGRVQGRV